MNDDSKLAVKPPVNEEACVNMELFERFFADWIAPFEVELDKQTRCRNDV